MLEGVVLAGGASTRMGSPKALLRAPDGQSFLIRIVRTFLDAGLTSVAVVTGFHHQRIVDGCRDEPIASSIRFVRNPEPERGQLSSLLVGLNAVAHSETSGLLVTLVDVPLVTPETVVTLIEAWQRTASPIVRPRVAGAHGHPVIFDQQVFDALRAAPLESGARHVIRDCGDRVQAVDVTDRGCLVDVDTPDDYVRLPSAT